MSDKKNLDRLFQEKLQDFEQAPRPDVWGQIQGRMQQKKKRRFAAWWWYGAAAILLLSLFVFWPEDPASEEILTQPIITSTPKTEDNSDNPIEKKEEKEFFKNPDPVQEDQILITENPSKENISPTNPVKINNEPSQTSISNEVIAQNVVPEKESVVNDKLNVDLEQGKKTNINDVTISNFNDNQKKVVELKLPVEKKVDSTKKKIVEQKKKDIFATVDEEITEDKEPKKRKWSLRPLVAFSTMANSSSSPSGPTFRNNATSGNSSVNYGVSVAYELNDRLTLQTGVMTQNMNFNTQDVVVIQQPNVFSPASAISLRSDVSYIVSGSSSLVTVGNSSANIAIADQNAELNQVIRYVEIPVEAKYRVTSSKKIRSYLIGGFSSLFLQNNEVILVSDVVGRNNIGTASNLNSVNFSGNIGLDFDYQISQNLFLNLNPMFKVHLNTFSRNSNGYQPYFMGVYSGVKYRF